MRRSISYTIDGSIMTVRIASALTQNLVNELTIGCGMLIGEYCIETLILDLSFSKVSSVSAIELLHLLYHHMRSRKGRFILHDSDLCESYILTGNGHHTIDLLFVHKKAGGLLLFL